MRAKKTISDKWESQLWRDKKFSLIDHLRYSRVHPESIPRKFSSEHRHFLGQQFNSQPAKYVPPEGRVPKLDHFKSARSLGHFELTILGKSPVLFFECYCLLVLCCSVMSCEPMDYSLLGSSVHGESPGKNTGVGYRAFLQGIFPTQGSNPGLPHCK